MSSEEFENEKEERGGVLAAEVVLQVLSAFIGAEPAVMLKTLATRARMHPAKAHRYLVSLCRFDFVRQDPETGLYQLSEGALRLGLAALEMIDPVTVSRPVLRTLRETTQLTAILALWDVNGPVVALQEIHPAPLRLFTRVGSPLPLLTTSTGWTFCAWLPHVTFERAIAHARTLPASPGTLKWLRHPERMKGLLKAIRHKGVCYSSGEMNSSVHGLSAPVFDGEGHIVGVISVLGAAGQVDLHLEGAVAAALKRAAADISQELGWLINTD
jgi:DNA-binding IclR family transcriptional regulator